MNAFRAILLITLSLAAAGCSSKFKSYDGPEVTRVLVYKDQRKMHLLSGPKVLKSYDVGLGFSPVGDKRLEGDGRTPVGTYRIDKRNPDSTYHLSVGISYPDARDHAEAAALGGRPGGDIFIHGRGKTWSRDRPSDWTAGCIAITDKEVEDVYAMVRDGTPITIYERAPTLVTAPAGMPGRGPGAGAPAPGTGRVAVAQAVPITR